jgi:hypothetical protein
LWITYFTENDKTGKVRILLEKIIFFPNKLLFLILFAREKVRVTLCVDLVSTTAVKLAIYVILFRFKRQVTRT